MIELGVNIDHVATIRQARRTYEPDPVWAAAEAQLGGADGITMHLREDRRHIQDADVQRVKQACQIKLNLEMAATEEMVAIACRVKPHLAMLVPEGRMEVTTEGGLDIAGQLPRLQEVVRKLTDAGMGVSAFIDADPVQVDAAAVAGFSTCEVHTGPYAHAHHRAGGDLRDEALRGELQKIGEAGRRILQAGMRFNAGHALNYHNVQPVAALVAQGGMADGGAVVGELHIGHAIVSRAVFIGMRAAVAEMKRLMTDAALRAAAR